MRQVPLQHVSKSLHAKFDHIAEEPLPKRWVELIHHLNEHHLNEIERRQKRARANKNEGMNQASAHL